MRRLVTLTVAMFCVVSSASLATPCDDVQRSDVADVQTPRPTCPENACDTSATLQLVLNIPSFQLDLFDRGRLLRSYPVAIGMPRFRTPVGRFEIDYLVWNPWWRPPVSEWARKERPQPPGWKNPVGRVKMHVHALVFLHGTPFVHSMGSAASHGCIRMLNVDAIELARFIQTHTQTDGDEALLDSLVADTSRTMEVRLAHAVPFYIRYDLVELRDSLVFVYRDVYRYGGTRVPNARLDLMATLVNAGRDTTKVNAGRVRSLLRGAGRATQRVVLDSLFITEGGR